MKTDVSIVMPFDKRKSTSQGFTLRMGDARSTTVMAALTDYEAGEGDELWFVGTRADGRYVEERMEVEGKFATCGLDSGWSGCVGSYRHAYIELRGPEGVIATTGDVPVKVIGGSDIGQGPAEPHVKRIEAALAASAEATGKALEAEAAMRRAETAAKSAKDAMEVFVDTYVVNYKNLSAECRAMIASSAGAGADLATEDDVEAAWEEIVKPALAASVPTAPTEEEYGWALAQIFSKGE